MEMTSKSDEATASVSNDLSQSGVCPLPSFLPSRLSDNMVTSTQKEQASTQQSADSWRNGNYLCDTEILDTASTQQTIGSCGIPEQKHGDSHLRNMDGVKENLLAVRHILLKLLALPDNKQIMKRLGYLSDVLDTITFFIKFASRFEESCDSQFGKTDSEYLGDVSNLSSLYLNHLISGFKKGHRRLVELKTSSLENNVFSQGDSFESGNFVYAPKTGNLYGPAEIQNSAVTSTSREKEMCCVKFLKTVPGGSESTEVIEDEVISVHCQSIYNHERLPVNARVLVKPSFDQADADESRETAFRPATIEKVFEKKGRSKQSSYAYLVRFLDNMEYQRVNHEQVLIEKAELQSVSKSKRCEVPLKKAGEEPSPTRQVNECFRQLSLDSKVAEMNCPKDAIEPSKETSSLFVLEEGGRKTSLKRHLSEQVSSWSNPEVGPSATKKVEKIFSGVHFVLTGFKTQVTELGSCQSFPQRECFTGETVRGRRDSNQIESAEEIATAPKEPEDEDEPQDGENGNGKSDMTESRLKEMIEENGGKICETVEKMKTLTNDNDVFLLAPKALTSPKYLGALALDIPCLNGPSFILACIMKGKLLSSTIDSYRLPAGWGYEYNQWSIVEWQQCKSVSVRRTATRKDLFSQRKIYLPLCSESSPLSTVLTFTRAEVAPLNRQRCTTRSSGIDETSFQNSFAIVGPNFRFSDDVQNLLRNLQVPILKARYISQCLIHGKELPFLDYLVD